MDYMLLTPGTGHFYCGSCLRDNTLAVGLRALGHDVQVVPLYLPLMLEDPTTEEGSAPVHMGGINMFLQQKSRLAAWLPGPLAGLLDRPGLLRWASRRGSLTEAPDLGAMTLSMLQGEHGRQNHELEKFVGWVADSQRRPDVIVISNLLLTGVVRRMREALQVPVVATMQGEAPFLNTLPSPFGSKAWDELSSRALDLDARIAVSSDYRNVMSARLGLDPTAVHVVHNGLDLADYQTEPPPLRRREPRTVGYLARMCRDKGLHTLVDAFLELKRRVGFEDLRLVVCGVQLREDQEFVRELRSRIVAAGHGDQATFHPNVTKAEKLAQLRSFTVFSVPATYGESFGLYLLEAMASGVPVVQPRHAAFPEILDRSGGGLLCEPDSPPALAAGLAHLLEDLDQAQEYANRGRQSVLDHFHADRMADEFAQICATVVR